ncbi:MAG: bifunctional folylpolyglutamate synthase/dihydrofolate synthase [Acidobacteria bacterium]|nr:bifunctional folylpolyglutamate synthase/dihydrofolate synthase [Acidobacteriota bacterium]
MNYPASVEYLYALGNELKTAKLGLECVSAVASKLGDPQRAFRTIHVAGTNGKGSTCAMIASALGAALYTSPHLVEPTERIVIGGKPATKEQFARAFEQVHAVSEEMIAAGELESHPTYFETVTLMAFCLFKEARVEWAIIEVGLGGRLDATNIVAPEVCVITPVDYDHEAWLGKSIESIAFEKAGILKPNAPAVIAPQHPAAMRVIEDRARDVGAELIPVAVPDAVVDAWGSQFAIEGITYTCPLAGRHQVVNAATAIAACLQVGFDARGITKAKWPGRLEKIGKFVLDGAHNPAGARALAAYIGEFHAGKKIGLIYGAMRDKSVEEIVAELFPLAHEVVVTAPGQARALRPEAILEMEPHARARAVASIVGALESDFESELIFITGSLFLVGEARAILVQ